MAKVPHTANELFDRYKPQRQSMFRTTILEAPPALSGLEIPNVEFFIITANTPEYVTNVTEIRYQNKTIPIPVADGSPRVFNTRIRYMANSKVLQYLREWKFAVSNPNTGFSQSNSSIVGKLMLELLTPDGQHTTQQIIMDRCYISRLGSASLDTGSDGFVEIDAEFRFVSWTDEILEVPEEYQ